MATSTMTSTATAASATTPLLPHKRHSNPKKPDPFLDLPITTPSPKSSPPQTPPHPTSAQDDAATGTPSPAQERDSLLYRTIVTPFLFTSFLLSLFLVNRQDLSRRAAAHPSSAPNRRYHISPGSWLSPEPYQNQHSGAWHVEHPPAAAAGKSERAGGKKGWFYRKKHRAMARLEIGDAFDMRGRVLVGLVAATVVAMVGCGWVLWRAYWWWLRG